MLIGFSIFQHLDNIIFSSFTFNDSNTESYFSRRLVLEKKNSMNPLEQRLCFLGTIKSWLKKTKVTMTLIIYQGFASKVFALIEWLLLLYVSLCSVNFIDQVSCSIKMIKSVAGNRNKNIKCTSSIHGCF